MDAEDERDRWAVTCWHVVGWHADLLFVVAHNGKPAANWHPTASPMDAYTWRGYHAAAKWLREHRKELPGYTVRNLDQLYRESQLARDRP